MKTCFEMAPLVKNRSKKTIKLGLAFINIL